MRPTRLFNYGIVGNDADVGGISFLRYQTECRLGSDWPPIMTAEDTIYSCTQTNKPESLYHQNWKVRAKRVSCPENLTRITGCRLQDSAVPAPDPTVLTPSDADANGTFTAKDQYGTTTMPQVVVAAYTVVIWEQGSRSLILYCK